MIPLAKYQGQKPHTRSGRWQTKTNWLIYMVRSLVKSNLLPMVITCQCVGVKQLCKLMSVARHVSIFCYFFWFFWLKIENFWLFSGQKCWIFCFFWPEYTMFWAHCQKILHFLRYHIFNQSCFLKKVNTILGP